MRHEEMTSGNILVWEEPVIIPKPNYCLDIPSPVLSLNSDAGFHWQFGNGARSFDDIIHSDRGLVTWSDILVPGEPAMQGHDLENDVPYYYKTKFMIPSNYTENKIFLRFNGVYSKAKVWVNNEYIREHRGGFTTWDCDITHQVVPGSEATVIVEFIDDIWDPSIGSIYAHHNMGGIINSVELLAVPQTHITKMHYTVDFDKTFHDAELTVTLGVSLGYAAASFVQLELLDSHNNVIQLDHSFIEFQAESQVKEVIFHIANPVKWDAEHPNLYTLQAKLYNESLQTQLLQACQVKVGFRKITYGGKDGTDKREIYVNGQRVKLRGTCRHHVHPTLGRTVTPEMDREDVVLLKGQNVNYVRTTHYPPTQEFLDACDELGMYVEEETAVNFQYANGPGPWRDDESWFMDQFSEMVERDKSHPCVLIWSLGNESGWRAGVEGDKFRKQYQYIKQVDRSRPAKFSYPFNIEDGTVMDIYSVHYAKYTDSPVYLRAGYTNGEGSEELVIEYNGPVIHDEYAHIACYNLNELERDNNVRNFWGESLTKFWQQIVLTEGALGGALWANIDDVFQLPEGVRERHQLHSSGTAAGYGEWGNMCDQWRREKPEYWLTKKAYSPIRIEDKPLGNPGHAELRIPIFNWFNHTNLLEVQVLWSITVDDHIVEQGQMMGPDVKPYQQGVLVFPKRAWREAEHVYVKFITTDGITVDEYDLPLAAAIFTFEEERLGSLSVEESDDQLSICSEALEIVYSKQTAQIVTATYQGQLLMTGGPRLHLTGEELGEWNAESMSIPRSTEQLVELLIIGEYSNGLKVQFLQTIENTGKFTTSYRLLDCKINYEQSDYGVMFELHQSQDDQWDAKLNELGLVFDLHQGVTGVEWRKEGAHSVYPEHHIGRSFGHADRIRQDAESEPDRYRIAPSWNWKDDMRNFYLEDRSDRTKGLVTRDFNSMREHIKYYSVLFEHTDARIRVESPGTDAARIHYGYTKRPVIQDRDLEQISYTGNWQDGSDPKCLLGTETFSNQPGAKAEFSFQGTGIRVLYKKQRTNGKMLVSIDQQHPERIDTFSDIGTPLYQQIYEIKDLMYGQHTITIEVPEDNEGRMVSIDAFEIIDSTTITEIEAKLIVNNEWRYSGLSWGNYLGPVIKISDGYENQVTLRFTDHNR
ncbi:glycoside hydrolase family 2 TIM barrel-domain containing protein [Paenibacillus sp. FSL R10-2734]|uniref:glycoside hydrolase family 2 protein n=1 Tax=Paenibacillus sp. FSL R10-2734 TaxID=2954691 RepID=UPI0030DA0298